MILKRCRLAPPTAALAAVLATAAAAFAFGQDGATVPTAALSGEPPSSLYASRIGDADVELLVQGFWELSVASSGLLAFGQGSTAYNPVPLLFTQRPDLYVLLEFRKTWWLETWVTESVESATFALGYTGPEGAWLREARLGNSGIAMPSTGLLNFGRAQGSFGASMAAMDEDSGSSFYAMARWDGLQWKSERYVGLSVLRESSVDASQWLRGRSFVFPDSAVSGLDLYEILDGVSRRLSADEYSASLAQGTALLAKAIKGELWAAYSSGGNPPTGYTGLVDGRPAVLLWEPSAYNQYEAKNLYALGVQDLSRLAVLRSESGGADPAYAPRVLAGGLVLVTPLASPNPRDPGYKEPFAAEAPWIYEAPPADPDDKPPYPAASGFSVSARTGERVDELRIDSGALEGSVSVYRDGAPSTAFVHDAATGLVTLSPPPRTGEDILLQYALPSTDRGDGALVAGALAGFRLSGWELFLGAGTRWPLPGLAYAEGELKPAWAGLTAGASLRGDAFAFAVEVLGRYRRASSSDRYRLAGMEDAGGALSPFTPAEGALSPIQSLSYRDEDLAQAFPEDMARFHAAGEQNLALRVSASGMGTQSLRRFVDEAPVEAFSRFRFFLRLEAGTASSLRVALGSSLVCTIVDPGSLPIGTWLRVSAELSPGGRVLVEDGDGNDLTPAGSTIAYDPGGSRGWLELSAIEPVALILCLDELTLEASASGLSMLADLSASYAGDGLTLDLKALGQAGGLSGLNARASALWLPGPLVIRADLAPSLYESGASLSYAYSLKLPEGPLSVVEEFSATAHDASFAHATGLSLSLSGFLASARAEASVARDRDALSARRSWEAGLGWEGAAMARAKLAADGPWSGPSGAEHSWLSGWKAYWLDPEQASYGRSSDFSLDILSSSIVARAYQAAAEAGPSRSRFALAAKRPFSLGLFKLEPFYERVSELSAPGASDSFPDDYARLGEAWLASAPFWSRWPITEFFQASEDLASGIAGPGVVFEHKASAGLSLTRPMGQGGLDLWLPSSLQLAWTKRSAARDDTVSDQSELRLASRLAAANIFGPGGALPVAPAIAYDEYSSLYELTLSSLLSAQAPLAAFRAVHGLSMEFQSGSALSLENGLILASERSGTRLGETLRCSLSIPRPRTLLGDLVSLALPRYGELEQGEAPAEAQEDGKASSDWLKGVLSSTPTLSDAWTIGFKADDASAKATALSLDLGFKTSYRAASSLSFSFRAEMGVSVQLEDAGALWSLRYLVGIEGRAVF